MSGIRILTHLISVALLLLWGGVMLYFYASGRIIHYLPPDGIFQPMVLVAGIGLMVLGLFNLLTLGQKEHDCSHDHGHSHDDHDSCGATGSVAASKPAAHSTCCDHDHSHTHSPAHTHSHDHPHEHHHHEHNGCCGHDHSEHPHDHTNRDATGPAAAGEPAARTPCCDHDHHHSHDHPHHHDHEHNHAHGMLEESGFTGRLIAISILAIPLTLAALNTPDQFSPAAIANKGLYNPNYADNSRADQFSLKKAQSTAPGIPSTQPAAADLVATTDSPLTTPDSPPGTPSPAATTPAGSDPPAAASGSGGSSTTPAEPQSYGSFTLADLEAQVPKSEAGNFILDVPEIYYTGGDIEVQNVLKGQPVETIAQVLPEKVNNDDGHRLRIFRMLVQCCAADARPYSIPVDFGKPAPDFKEMAWVKVVGKIDYKEEGGQTVPVMSVTSIEETTAPDQTMIY